jgi:hypothetical protein
MKRLGHGMTNTKRKFAEDEEEDEKKKGSPCASVLFHPSLSQRLNKERCVGWNGRNKKCIHNILYSIQFTAVNCTSLIPFANQWEVSSFISKVFVLLTSAAFSILSPTSHTSRDDTSSSTQYLMLPHTNNIEIYSQPFSFVKHTIFYIYTSKYHQY